MLDPGSNRELPPIPAKRYFTIGEVAELCDVKPHVLRYWETEFPTLKPVKRRGNRRYYQRADVLVIRQIRGLLYEEGYTIGGARLRIDTEKQAPSASAKAKAGTSTVATASGAVAPIDTAVLREVREELESVLALLRS
jgi:DNA-binding transcriptional MerR regulator